MNATNNNNQNNNSKLLFYVPSFGIGNNVNSPNDFSFQIGTQQLQQQFQSQAKQYQQSRNKTQGGTTTSQLQSKIVQLRQNAIISRNKLQQIYCNKQQIKYLNNNKMQKLISNTLEYVNNREESFIKLNQSYDFKQTRSNNNNHKNNSPDQHNIEQTDLKIDSSFEKTTKITNNIQLNDLSPIIRTMPVAKSIDNKATLLPYIGRIKQTTLDQRGLKYSKHIHLKNKSHNQQQLIDNNINIHSQSLQIERSKTLAVDSSFTQEFTPNSKICNNTNSLNKTPKTVSKIQNYDDCSIYKISEEDSQCNSTKNMKKQYTENVFNNYQEVANKQRSQSSMSYYLQSNKNTFSSQASLRFYKQKEGKQGENNLYRQMSLIPESQLEKINVENLLKLKKDQENLQMIQKFSKVKPHEDCFNPQSYNMECFLDKKKNIKCDEYSYGLSQRLEFLKNQKINNEVNLMIINWHIINDIDKYYKDLQQENNPLQVSAQQRLEKLIANIQDGIASADCNAQIKLNNNKNTITKFNKQTYQK